MPRRDYKYNFENVIPTDRQIMSFGDGRFSNVKLTRDNMFQIFDVMKLSDDLKEVMWTYLTGNGKYDDYSQKYLYREYSLEPIIYEYNRKASKYLEDLVHAIIVIRDEKRAAREAEALETYKSQAAAIFEKKDVEGLTKILKFLDDHNYDVDLIMGYKEDV